MDRTKAYRRIARSLAQMVSLAKMYKCNHPMVAAKAEDTYKELAGFFSEAREAIVFAKSADMLLINGEKIEPDNTLMKKFIEDFAALDIGSIELEPGTAREELTVFILLLCQAGKTCGVEKVKQFLSEKRAGHLIPRAATFKLVSEDEDVIKKDAFIKVEEVPPEVLKMFSRDLKDGKVRENLGSSGKEYRLAAHNSTLLAGIAFDLLGEKGSKTAPEDLEKVLWLMADYLIDEIGSFKEEDLNRKVLEEIRDKLLSKWHGRPEEKELTGHMEKTYVVINTALQLKGLLAIHKKHKKAMDSAAKKIKSIMSSLPPDSQLYKKTVKSFIEAE
jgi:hypothetical protein